jgi:purine-cytosine permease-like protein
MADKNGSVATALLAVPVAGVALAILAIDEVDEAFANVYSTAISTQNILPRLDRRVLAATIGVLATAIALLVDLQNYESFLLLLGAVFVPLSAVLIVTFFTQRREWDTSANAPARPWLLLPWVLGFLSYQLVYPTPLTTWWTERWTAAQTALHFTPQPWMSASLLSFAIAAVVTLVVLPLSRRR